MFKEASPLENSLRIKITGKCNRDCFFCHQEGGMDIDDIETSPELKSMIERLSSEFNIKSIALTGGEPLLYSGLVKLASSFIKYEGIKQISLTTNGTIFKDREFWNDLKTNGLYKVNISMPDTLGTVDAEARGNGGLTRSVLDNRINLIKLLNKLHIDVNINIAIINDIYYTNSIINLLNSLDGVNYDIVLLPNLSSKAAYEYSQKTIKMLVDTFRFQFSHTRIRRNTSNIIDYYRHDFLRPIQVKKTMVDGVPFFLEGICTNCRIKNVCQEGFYGLRIERNRGIYYIRTCIHKSDNTVLIPFTEFFQSDCFRILKQIWN